MSISLFLLLSCQTPKYSPTGEPYSFLYRMFNAKEIQFEYDCGRYPNCPGNYDGDTAEYQEEIPGKPLSKYFQDGTASTPSSEILEDAATYFDVPLNTLSYERRDMDEDGVQEWFVYTERCYAVGCEGSLYIPKKRGWCYAGSGLDVLISHDQLDGWTLSCEKYRKDLQRYTEDFPE